MIARVVMLKDHSHTILFDQARVYEPSNVLVTEYHVYLEISVINSKLRGKSGLGIISRGSIIFCHMYFFIQIPSLTRMLQKHVQMTM